jgi:hypothetical protein
MKPLQYVWAAIVAGYIGTSHADTERVHTPMERQVQLATELCHDINTRTLATFDCQSWQFVFSGKDPKTTLVSRQFKDTTGNILSVPLVTQTAPHPNAHATFVWQWAYNVASIIGSLKK